jgi:hypothetical protein
MFIVFVQFGIILIGALVMFSFWQCIRDLEEWDSDDEDEDDDDDGDWWKKANARGNN